MNLADKGFKAAIINMFKKENIFKELKKITSVNEQRVPKQK